MSYFIHNVPGRLRVKIPAVKGEPESMKKIAGLFEKTDGILNVFVNTITGSVTITYDPETVLSEKLLLVLRENGYLDSHQVVSGDLRQQQTSTRAGQVVGRAVFGWAVGRALEGSGFGFLAALI